MNSIGHNHFLQRKIWRVRLSSQHSVHGSLLNLELKHIDIDRRQLVIKNSKGRRDRNIILAESFIPLLINYTNTYRPIKYFVEVMRMVMLKGSTFTDIIPQFSKTLAYAIIMNSLAVWSYKKTT